MQIQCKLRLKQLQREREISSWAGAEKFCNGLEFRRKNGIFVASGPGPCHMAMTSLVFLL